LSYHSIFAKIIYVPADFASIQAGINAAGDGDTVLVVHGTYFEQLTIHDKAIVLSSDFIITQDSSAISQTIIDGNNSTYVIRLESTAGSGTAIIGFTIQNGDDGILPMAHFNLSHNVIRNYSDGIDYETGGGGICQNNTFELNSDDGIDLDGAVDITISNNKIINNGDDGIEIRLHEYSGPLLTAIIKDNIITGNDEDGIQIRFELVWMGHTAIINN
jgi:hypothetical protein